MSKSSEEGAAGNASPQDTGAGNDVQKDANGNIYEDRAGTKKIIRVITVMAYVFSVSFAAILLSAYYVFLWEPPNPRLQRHPLSSDPQADYLTNNIIPIKNFNNLSNDTDDQSIPAPDSDDTLKKFNIFKRIMSSDQKVINYPQSIATIPQKLLAYEDFLKLPDKTVDSLTDSTTTKPTVIDELSKSVASSESPLTTLPIFDKPYRSLSSVTMPRGALTGGRDDGKTMVENESLLDDYKSVVNLRLVKNMSSLFDRGIIIGLLEGSKIRTEYNNDDENESKNSSWPSWRPETLNNETTTVVGSLELNTSSAVSNAGETGERLVYSGIENNSYPKTIGDTLQNNKATIGTELTTETPTSGIPALLSELENFEMNLRKHDESRLPDDSEDEELPTIVPEVQIYPAESARDILDDRK